MKSSMKSTAEEFEDFFGKMISEFRERKYSGVDVMNPLDAARLFQSQDQKTKDYMAEVTVHMNVYVAYLEKSTLKRFRNRLQSDTTPPDGVIFLMFSPS